MHSRVGKREMRELSFVIIKNDDIPNCQSDKGFKGTVVNRERNPSEVP